MASSTRWYGHNLKVECLMSASFVDTETQSATHKRSVSPQAFMQPSKSPQLRLRKGGTVAEGVAGGLRNFGTVGCSPICTGTVLSENTLDTFLVVGHQSGCGVVTANRRDLVAHAIHIRASTQPLRTGNFSCGVSNSEASILDSTEAECLHQRLGSTHTVCKVHPTVPLSERDTRECIRRLPHLFERDVRDTPQCSCMWLPRVCALRIPANSTAEATMTHTIWQIGRGNRHPETDGLATTAALDGLADARRPQLVRRQRSHPQLRCNWNHSHRRGRPRGSPGPPRFGTGMSRLTVNPHTKAQSEGDRTTRRRFRIHTRNCSSFRPLPRTLDPSNHCSIEAASHRRSRRTGCWWFPRIPVSASSRQQADTHNLLRRQSQPQHNRRPKRFDSSWHLLHRRNRCNPDSRIHPRSALRNMQMPNRIRNRPTIPCGQ